MQFGDSGYALVLAFQCILMYLVHFRVSLSGARVWLTALRGAVTARADHNCSRWDTQNEGTSCLTSGKCSHFCVSLSEESSCILGTNWEARARGECSQKGGINAFSSLLPSSSGA